MTARPDDALSIDTERTQPGFSTREIVERGLEGVLDGLTELLQEEIERHRRTKSDPPSGDRETLPSVH